MSVRISDHASKQDAILAAIALAAGIDKAAARKRRDGCGHFFGYGEFAGLEWITAANNDGKLVRVDIVA